MNERIQELADQALKACDDAKERGIAQYSKRFAELIVRECANIAFDEYASTNGADSGESAILKHFGVEK